MATVTLKLVPFQPAEIDLKGFQGQGCKDIADLLAQMGETAHRHRKPEFFQPQVQATVATAADDRVGVQHTVRAGG